MKNEERKKGKRTNKMTRKTGKQRSLKFEINSNKIGGIKVSE